MNELAPIVSSAGRPTSAADLFTRLEERVVQLAERYREAQKAIEELDCRLRETEARAQRLESELAAREEVRDELRVRLDRIIEWVRALERSAQSEELASDADLRGA
jgi:chromosome segregation ATPase